MNQEWKSERIIADYETSLIPTISAEVNSADYLFKYCLFFL